MRLSIETSTCSKTRMRTARISSKSDQFEPDRFSAILIIMILSEKSIGAGLPPREYVIEEYVKTVCPDCFAERQRRSDEEDVWKDGMLVVHDGKVWMRRFCSEHGETESLYEGDAEIWRARRGWNTSTLKVNPDRKDNYAGFPDGYRRGLPGSHGQHTCIVVLNITERCNYACKACYASALPPGTPEPTVERPTIDEIE